MDVIKLGRKGQVSIPRAILRRLRLESEAIMLVEVTADGGILLRPAGLYPIELYSEERISEFLREDRMPRRKSRP